ncbi:hypothetical protein Hanom_Chr09g00789381 [Helianthus anomalus]
MQIQNIRHVIIFKSCCFYSVLCHHGKKMEFESWPALLDEVQARFDTNAGQLWFPLHSVLQICYADAQTTM